MIKPYYENENGRLYCANCLDVMPELEGIDLCITDPPYGMKYQSNYRKEKHNKIQGDEFLPLNLINMAISLSSHAAYIFCRWNNLPSMPTPKSVLAWIKNNWSAGDLKHEHGRQWEACCFYPKEKHAFLKRIPDVLFANKTKNDLHPTQKPVDLFMQIIQCNVGNTVFDPFMGSGGIAIACERLNRKWIGIEISEEYCEIAAKRIELERKQLKFC